MRSGKILVLLVVMAFLAAACGGDEPTADEAQEAAEEAVDDALDAAEDAGDAAGFMAPQECIEIATAMASAAGAAAAGTSGQDPSGSIASLKAMSEVAPEEIADDLAVVAEAFQEYLDILAAAGVDFSDPTTFSSPEAIAAAEEAAAVLSAPEVETAIDNASSGLEELCATG